MTEERYIVEGTEDFFLYIEDTTFTEDKHESSIYDIYKVVHRLNEQHKQIKELEKEKQDLKDKAKILVDYYSRRYVNAIFNNGKHSKQFKSDLWIVKEVLCVLDLYDEGDVE